MHTLSAVNLAALQHGTHFTSLQLTAGPFQLAALRKQTDPSQPLRVYLEGDGRAYINRGLPSADPTPTQAIAFSLAAVDPGPNVVYLARPCQFFARQHQSICQDNKWWTTHRFDQTTLNSLSAALDQLKANPAQPLELVGFSGGATHALLLAATRKDVRSVRTVAGNLDPHLVNAHHRVTPMAHALSPLDYRERLRRIPQRHVVGGADRIIPPQTLKAYQSRLGPTPCLSSSMQPNATHTSDWATLWAAELAKPITCVQP